MEIIYRIYQVNRQFNESDDLLNQEVMITESGETFKDNMRLLYPNIKFANSKKLKDGDVYCIIISDNCYNAEKYITVLDYKCSHCNKTFKSNEKLLIKFGSYFNSISLFDNKIDKSVVNDYIDKKKKKNSNLLNERERFYIHKYYVENPQLCLNVIIPRNNNN